MPLFTLTIEGGMGDDLLATYDEDYDDERGLNFTVMDSLAAFIRARLT